MHFKQIQVVPSESNEKEVFRDICFVLRLSCAGNIAWTSIKVYRHDCKGETKKKKKKNVTNQETRDDIGKIFTDLVYIYCDCVSSLQHQRLSEELCPPPAGEL